MNRPLNCVWDGPDSYLTFFIGNVLDHVKKKRSWLLKIASCEQWTSVNWQSKIVDGEFYLIKTNVGLPWLRSFSELSDQQEADEVVERERENKRV